MKRPSPTYRHGADPFLPLGPIVWEGKRDRVVLSPADGGRVISWRHGRAGELVRGLDVADGGLLRVLLGEERYPGASYVTPHLVHVQRQDERGFRAHMRYIWNTPNAIAWLLGWPDKVNPVYLDGLQLDKIVTFDAAQSVFLVELSIANYSGEMRKISPWLHNNFQGWVDQGFVVRGGREEPYTWHDIYWAGHHPLPGKTMRLVHADRRGSLFAVLGSGPSFLAGMASYTHADFGEGNTEGCMELRGKTLSLAPGTRWCGTAFLAMTQGPESWRRWAVKSPLPLVSFVDEAAASYIEPSSVAPLLHHWALPEERRKGLMAISWLDKIPFTSASRYSASNTFAGFHPGRSGRAQASVGLVPLRMLDPLRVELRGGRGWNLVAEHERGRCLTVPMTTHQPVRLLLEGPSHLTGRESVEVHLSTPRERLVVLGVPRDASVGPRHPYQVKQVSSYLEDRFWAEKDSCAGRTTAESRRWQAKARRRLLQWARDAVTEPSPLAPRLMERQVGPHCVREKILIQTEPGIWMPMYLVYPRNAGRKKIPAILFPHGSGPGKLRFAPDETADVQHRSHLNRWPSPYQLAHQLGCIVLLPDRRGWGEWSEANHGQRPHRAERAGYNITAMEAWDHLRAVDFLVSNRNVDTRRIFSMGSSGGGWLTLLLMAADVRLAGGIASSTPTTKPSLPEQYFYQVFENEEDEVDPTSSLPMSTATIGCLAAPRPLWVMDGRWDRQMIPPPPHTEAEEKSLFARNQARANAGREEIGRLYRALGASSRYEASWFDGGHMAGFTFRNIAKWLGKHFGICSRHRL